MSRCSFARVTAKTASVGKFDPDIDLHRGRPGHESARGAFRNARARQRPRADYARSVPPLFPDFLENPASYQAVVAFWDRLVSDVERSLGQADEWGRWVPRHFADGTPMD